MNYQIKKANNLYYLLDENGLVVDTKRSIGLNRFNDLSFGEAFSYYNGKLDITDKVYLDNPLGEQRIALIGDLTKIFQTLKHAVSKNKDNEFVDVCASIIEALNDYFGITVIEEEKYNYFPTEEEVSSGNVARGKVSDLEKKNAATSFIRAMASQNILKTLGYDSGIKISMININGHEEVHAYNVVSHNDKYYIFDSSIPTLIEERINPIVCEIPKEVYNSLIYPCANYPNNITPYAIRVSHYNPFPCEKTEVIYDSLNSKIYDVNNNKNKTI